MELSELVNILLSNSTGCILAANNIHRIDKVGTTKKNRHGIPSTVLAVPTGEEQGLGFFKELEISSQCLFSLN